MGDAAAAVETPAAPATELPSAADISFSTFARTRAEAGIDHSAPKPDAEVEEPHTTLVDKPHGRDEKGRFLPRGATAAPAKKDEPGKPEKQKSKAPQPEPTPDASPPGEPRALFAAARKTGRPEDLDKALLSVGVKPGEFAINSRQWSHFRAQRKEQNAQVEAKYQEAVGLARQARDEVAPYIGAKEHLAKRDVESWVRAATGGQYSFSDISKMALRQHHEEPLAVKELREQNAELIRRLDAREQHEQQARAEADQRRQQNEAYEAFTSEIAAVTDQRVAKLARKPAFVQEVVRRIGQHWRDYGEELTTEEVAHDVFREEYGDLFDIPQAASVAPPNHASPSGTAPNPAAQTRAAPIPERPGTRVPTSLNLSAAAEVTAPIPERDSPERDALLKAKYKAQFRNSTIE